MVQEEGVTMADALTRLPDWRSRLAAEMDRQRRDPHAWGSHDCALGLAAGAVEAISGVDVAAPWRGRYTTPLGAARLLRKGGFDGVGDMVASVLPEIATAFANVGDIGVIDADGPVPEALCVVDFSGLIVMTESGHGRRAREDMRRAFRVG